MTTSRELDRMLTDPDSPLDGGALATLYRAQKRRVRELMDRLREVDKEWLEQWERDEGHRSSRQNTRVREDSAGGEK